MAAAFVTNRTATSPDDIASSPRWRAEAPSLSAAVRDASDVAVSLHPEDPRWAELGPLLTAFVDATRRAMGQGGSPILPAEKVPPILRLRDLAQIAARTEGPSGTSVAATPLVTLGLRSLQDAARRCPSG